MSSKNTESVDQRGTPEYYQGASAHRKGMDSDECPYPSRGETGTQRVRWMLGYYDRRRQLKFGLDDDEESVIHVTEK